MRKIRKDVFILWDVLDPCVLGVEKSLVMMLFALQEVCKPPAGTFHLLMFTPSSPKTAIFWLFIACDNKFKLEANYVCRKIHLNGVINNLTSTAPRLPLG